MLLVTHTFRLWNRLIQDGHTERRAGSQWPAFTNSREEKTCYALGLVTDLYATFTLILLENFWPSIPVNAKPSLSRRNHDKEIGSTI
ncbi:hypothetical protein TNCV_2511371 [Trichonephila clavipes]|nr:hypothetical protein TNCV_2511371 [Trichonephila clavipes]